MSTSPDDLKSSLCAMYRLAIEACQTKDECLALSDEILDLAEDLEHLADVARVDRIFHLEQATKGKPA